ncbi:MAG: GEVED domain-containing protein, partial [Flavobacteriaceae bacterium]
MTSIGSFVHRTEKTKRWLWWLTFCVMLFAGQSSFAQCDIEVNVQWPGCGDATTWQLLDGDDTVVLTGGTYTCGGYNDTQTTSFINPPYSLKVVITNFCDNGAIYSISVGGDADISGEVSGCSPIDETIPLIASACPTCPAPSGLSADILSLTQAELSWSSSGNDFDIEWGTQGFALGTGTSVTGFTATSTILSGLTGNTHYQFYVRQNCGVDGYSIWAGPYTFYTSYCEASTQWEWDYISSFSTTGGIINISNNSGGFSYPNGYGDYTTMSASHFEDGEVSFTLTTNSYFGVNIWIDWNNNLVFEESEKVYASGFMGNGPFTGSFTVPVGQALGDYRMRVRGSNDNDNPSPCGTINYGETEDYTFTVIETPTCLPPTELGANVNSHTEAELYWTSDGTLFEVEYGMQGFDLGTGTSVTGITTNNTTLTGLTPNTYHQYFVRRDCGDGDLSPWTGPYTFYTNYCEALTQWPSQWEAIHSFTTTGGITNISNNTGDNSYPNGYGDHTAMSASHFETGEVDFTVDTGNLWAVVSIWIDWNNNMVFEESEQVYISGDFTMQGPFTGTFTVPVGQAVGDYRVRVRASNNGGILPCGMINYGETEDYTFTVIETPTCMPPTQLGANINSFTEAELYWTSDGTLFEVEYGMQGFDLGTGTSVTGITTNDTTVSGLTQNTYYHYYVRRDCGDGDLSPWTGPYTFYTNYCETSSTYTGDLITSFATSGGITNISNPTGTVAPPNNYGDFTAMSVSHFETGEVEISITTNTF